MAESDNNENYQHTSVSGGFNQHTPAYWRLMLPGLAGRYFFRWMDGAMEVQNSKILGLKSGKFYDAAAGAWALSITAFFAARTAKDLKNVFTEAVAYELDKDPSKVTYGDLWKSDNNALQKARDRFVKFNFLRTAINSSFFSSFLPGTLGKLKGAELGVGLNGAYLVSEVMMRDMTFFEELQNFVDRKINQKHSLGEEIQALELVRLYERNAVDNDKKNAFSGNIHDPVWQESRVIFERMAELMNDSYQDRQTDKESHFTLPKFLYLTGHKLLQLDKVEQSLAYIEVANKYGMKALKEVVKGVQHGKPLQEALSRYPVQLVQPEHEVHNDIPYEGKCFAAKFKKPASHVEQVHSEPSPSFSNVI